MANLYWMTEAPSMPRLATRFKTEEKFEQLVFETPDIPPAISHRKRQVRGVAKSEISNIVGMNIDRNLCSKEINYVGDNATLIPQVNQFAFWAETIPDSMKSLWFRLMNDQMNSHQLGWVPSADKPYYDHYSQVHK